MSYDRLIYRRGLRVVISLLVLLVLAGKTQAEAEPGALSLVTSRAVVFKDGYALLVKTATGVADEQGRVHTLEVPDSAVLGSFWAVAEDEEILAMRAEYTDDWQRVDRAPKAGTSSLSALLAGAVDKQVTLVLTDGTITGTLIARADGNDESFVLIRRQGDGPQAPPVTVAQSSIVGVRSSALAGQGQVDPTFERVKRLSFDLGEEAAGKEVKLTVMYFTPGIRWIPTYRLGGELVDEAEVALQGEILNQCEDLDGVTLDLVVGVPHFRFRGVISPLSLEASLRNTLITAAPQLMGQMSNAMFTQRASEWRGHGQARPVATTANVNLPKELSGSKEQDLYVYSVPNFSLSVGGRATVPLWQAEAPLKHVYTLDLKVARNARHGGIVQTQTADARYPVGSPLRLLTTQVWHQLALTNESEMPWTTGAAMILRDELPIGQDLLTYTPPGGTTLLPMTVAVGIRGQLVEEEIERTPNALKWNRDSYVLVRKKGTITLANSHDTDADMQVTVSLAGKAHSASDDGDIIIDDYHADDWHGGNYWLNNHSDLTWELTLEAGETVTLNYEVSFYVR